MDLLLVEDDAVIASGLVFALEQAGYGVCHAGTVAMAQTMLNEKALDLAIVDMQLPDGDGFTVGEAALARGVQVIFLTVMDEEERIVRALDQGAADYVTKPFRLRELLARVRRALPHEESVLSMGKARIDTASGRVTVAGQDVALTALEYRLCLIFAMHRGQLLTRAQILDQLWDQNGNFVEDNTLTVYVKRLREKLGDAVTIETVRGLGYRVDA
ncbi:MAG: response regulator transcription factor [Peptococcaceae bacterium]|nr:response regulator transcription factor [Peptococcaceae bacterium]